MAIPVKTALKLWAGTLFTKDDWDFNFSQIVSWLGEGNSDLVVNTIKTTNGIDLDGAQISNLAPATSGSQAVTLDQANTLLNRTSYYYPFSVASGKVNSTTGNADYFSAVGSGSTTITVYAGNTNPDLVCVSSDGTIESVTSDTILNIPASEGTYHVVKEKGMPITITSGSNNKITIGKVRPTSDTNIGDYFLNNGVVPFKAYKYTSDGWEETPFCWLGDVTVTSDDKTATVFNFNNNRFDVILTESYINGESGYRVYSDGWCEQWGLVDATPESGAVEITFLKEFADTNYDIQLSVQSDRTGHMGGGCINPFVCSSLKLQNKMSISEYAIANFSYANEHYYWKVSGYLAKGEY